MTQPSACAAAGAAPHAAATTIAVTTRRMPRNVPAGAGPGCELSGRGERGRPEQLLELGLEAGVACLDLVVVAELETPEAAAGVHLEHELAVARVALEQLAQVVHHGGGQLGGVHAAAERGRPR